MAAPIDPASPAARPRFTVRRFPGLGYKVMDNGVMVGTELGPWWPTRKLARAEAVRRNEAV